MKDWIHKYFSEDDLITIKNEVNRIEKSTSGEIILSFRNKRSLIEKLYKYHELAMKDFEKLKVWNTKKRTGILVFIVFEEKYFDIIADEGIFPKIPDETWNRLEEKLKAEFRSGNYLNGMMHLISEMGDVLVSEFPVSPDDVNELPDDIVLN